MTPKQSLCVILMSFLLAACPSSGGSGTANPDTRHWPNLQAQGAPDGPLSQCAPGYWLDCGTDPCAGDSFFCGKKNPAPECQAPDCFEQSFTGYGADGKNWIGTFAASPTLGTYSGSATSEPYAIDDGASEVIGNAGTSHPSRAQANCTEQQMVLGGVQLLDRAPAPLASSLSQLAPALEWRAAPYPR